MREPGLGGRPWQRRGGDGSQRHLGKDPTALRGWSDMGSRSGRDVCCRVCTFPAGWVPAPFPEIECAPEETETQRGGRGSHPLKELTCLEPRGQALG